MTEHITVTGNLAADPEQRTTAPGVKVTSFRVGSTHRRYDRDKNEWIDEYTNWFTVSAWRGLGEHAFASLRRGDRVIVTGRLRLREWDNGTRKGVSADIDADAVGPDLLWSDAAVQRTRSTAPTGEPADPPPAEPSAAIDADGWALPAVTVRTPPSAPPPADPIPVGAFAGEEVGETPF